MKDENLKHGQITHSQTYLCNAKLYNIHNYILGIYAIFSMVLCNKHIFILHIYAIFSMVLYNKHIYILHIYAIFSMVFYLIL